MKQGLIYCFYCIANIFSLGVLISCGGSSGDSSGDVGYQPPTSRPEDAIVSFSLSDAPIEELSSVVITLQSVLLEDAEGREVSITEFVVPFEQGDGSDANDEQLIDDLVIDLLQVTGAEQQVFIRDLELRPGIYEHIRLQMETENLADSYVQVQAEGTVKPLAIQNQELVLDNMVVDEGATQTFVIEFDLRKALTYDEAEDVYWLGDAGLRIVDVAESAEVSGQLDLNEFAALFPCRLKQDTEIGNVLYIYQGADLNPDSLADNFDVDSLPEGVDSETLLAPFTTVSIKADGSYVVPFLPVGEYTFALSCEAENDDPVIYDAIRVLEPDHQLIELSLEGGDQIEQDFPLSR